MFEQPVSSGFVYVLNNNDLLLAKMFDICYFSIYALLLFFLLLWMKKRKKEKRERKVQKKKGGREKFGCGCRRWSWAYHLRMYDKTGYRELRDWSKMRIKNWKNWDMFECIRKRSEDTLNLHVEVIELCALVIRA